MINRAFKATNSLIAKVFRSYGELTYTNEIKVQSEFEKVPTHRVIDLDGKLINKNVKYDCD